MRRAAALLLTSLFAGGCATLEAARLHRSGTSALERGDVARAVADLEVAAAEAPNVSDVRNSLGVAYAAAGRREDAIREFRRAVELDCENALAARNLRRAQGEAEARN